MRKTVNLLIVIGAYVSVTTVLLSSCESTPANGQDTTAMRSVTQTGSALNGSRSNGVNFVPAAKAVTPGVVHIKTSYQNSSGNSSPYGGGRQRSMGSGSGVIISSDGYIATNNHVIDNASQIEVVLTDRRSFNAKLIGRDPNTDLALLKVDATNLTAVAMGNSDDLEVGEWVLAVGYPLSLNTTVTAGIVSAKGRSIGIINSSSPGSPQVNAAIESFIQTDAAINPGNSGGALVDLDGRLIGINTAIASLTGSYAGYAFAVPVNLAKKILDDLKEFGAVKRGLLGVSFPAPAAEDGYLKQQGINPGSVQGVFITGIQKGSAAAAAGLQEGDIIQSIDGASLSSSAEFSERIARRRPGDKVELKFLRNGKPQSTSATLKGEESQVAVASRSESLNEIYNRLGAVFSPLTPELKERYRLEAGVVVTQVRVGGFFDRVGIPPGTIIVYINGKAVMSPQEIEQALLSARNARVQILGVAPDGSRVAFNFSLGT